MELPTELEAALAERPDARAIYDGMPPSHRREYAGHVAEAQNPETRQRRALKMIDLIMTKAPRSDR